MPYLMKVIRHDVLCRSLLDKEGIAVPQEGWTLEEFLYI